MLPGREFLGNLHDMTWRGTSAQGGQTKLVTQTQTSQVNHYSSDDDVSRGCNNHPHSHGNSNF